MLRRLGWYCVIGLLLVGVIAGCSVPPDTGAPHGKLACRFITQKVNQSFYEIEYERDGKRYVFVQADDTAPTLVTVETIEGAPK
jgi:hypothetical protein